MANRGSSGGSITLAGADLRGMKMINPKHFEPKTPRECVFGNLRAQATLDSLISGAMPFPAFGKSGILLYGAWGTGKTTLAKLLPEAIEVARGGIDADYDFIPCGGKAVGAVSIANLISSMSFASFNASGLQYAVLDEADNLTELAQAQLKASMNLPQAVFILTTNYIQQIDKGVQSRCHLIQMDAAQPHQWLPLFHRIFATCGLAMPSANALLPVIQSANGSARDILAAAVAIAIQAKSAQGGVA